VTDSLDGVDGDVVNPSVLFRTMSRL